MKMGTSEFFQSGTAEADVPVRKCEKSNNDGLCSGVPVGKGGLGGLEGEMCVGASDDPISDELNSTDSISGAEYSDAPICVECGRPGGDLFSVGDKTVRVHPECHTILLERQELADGVGPVLVVVGQAPAGSRCYFCGSGGQVRLVRRRGGREVSQAHLGCAGKAWSDLQPPTTTTTTAPHPPGATASASVNGLAAGLPHSIIAKLAAAYVEVAEEYTATVLRRNGGTATNLHTLEAAVRRSLEAALRRRLAEMVLPEFVESTLEQVLAEVS
jgi:hypothetical protein